MTFTAKEVAMTFYTKQSEYTKNSRDFKKFESITKALQSASITLAEVRILFDSISSNFPSVERRLAMNGSLVFNEPFETGIVKVINGKESELSNEESEQMEAFLRDTDTDVQEIPEAQQDEDYARSLLKANERNRSISI